MKSAREWQSFYRAERAALGDTGLMQLLERAPTLQPEVLRDGGAIIFPHTRLTASGALTAAAAARAVVESGCDNVLALGVLHGAREVDAPFVARARSGDDEAVGEIRRVHGPGAPDDDLRWTQEFSLENFSALLEHAARMLHRPMPRMVCRFPFLTGAQPQTLPGFDELRELVNRGAAIVATTDPVHHGVGYDTPVGQRLPNNEAARDAARRWIEAQFSSLARRDFDEFLRCCAEVKSDFRDVGPVLVELLGGNSHFQMLDLQLVDYGDVLNAPDPTWVAAALVTVTGGSCPTPAGR